MSDKMERLIEAAAGGDAEARAFVKAFLNLSHRLDDLIDGTCSKEELLQVFMLTVSVCSLDRFYVVHREYLYPLIMSSINSYATSVAWETAEEAHRRQMSDHLRSNAVSVLEFVALITGGIAKMRELSPMLRENSWQTHHTETGEPK